MTIAARYIGPDRAALEATIDGVVYSEVRLDTDGYVSGKVKAWMAAGHAPEPYVAPSSPSAVIDGAVLLARVTDAEYAAIMAAAASNVGIARWIELLRMKGVVDLGDPVAQAAKSGLVAAGLLTAERAEAIFAP
jgi:hypothetical protein